MIRIKQRTKVNITFQNCVHLSVELILHRVLRLTHFTKLNRFLFELKFLLKHLVNYLLLQLSQGQ